MQLIAFFAVFTAIFPRISICQSHFAKNWWKEAVLYQIYPRSFADSDGDGVGDLKGIQSKLGYIQDLGLKATWLSPIYESPMKDFGYDIKNYTKIDPLFGTMQDFDSYVKESKEKDLKVIMDFVPNHSSNEHEWFIKSERKIDPYTDYYVWVDGNDTQGLVPPNNWLGMFGGSAWEWSTVRKQFYYHQFLKEQPDLNFRNPKVREEMKKIIRFWFDRGVDGLRIDAIPHLFEDTQLRDEPPLPVSSSKPGEYYYYDHLHTWNQPEIFDVIAEWKQVFDEYEARDGNHRLMMLETAMNSSYSLPYFGNDTHPLADMPFNFELIWHLHGMVSGEDVYKAVWGWLKYIPDTKWSNWVIGNHDQNRIANRTHVDLIDAFNMINLLLRGTPVTYYGEEIGMVDKFIAWNETQDPYGKWFGPDEYTKWNRDPQRTPMQWDDSPFAGFTRGNSSWLPVNENYKYLNVKNQRFTMGSHLAIYRQLIMLKNHLAIINGPIDFPLINKNIFSFTRTVKQFTSFVIIVNFGNETNTVNLLSKRTKNFIFPNYGTVEVVSGKIPFVDLHIRIDLGKIKIPPRQAIVISFLPIWEQ